MLRRSFLILLLIAGCAIPQDVQRSKGKGPKPKPPPEPVEMGILFFDGFEKFDASPTYRLPWATGGRNRTTSNPRTGSNALDLNTADVQLRAHNLNFDHGVWVSDFSEVDTYVSFYFRFNSSFSDEICSVRDSAGSLKASIEFLVSDKLKVTTTSEANFGTTVLNSGQYYRLDFRVGTGVSAFWELRIDGNVELSGTSNLASNNMAYVSFGPPTSTAVDGQIDDVVIRDDQFHPGDDYRVETLTPDGNGNYTSWTGSYTDVDENDPDGTEVTTSTNTNRETYTLGNVAALSGGDTIDAVKTFVVIRKDTNPDVGCQIIERESSTDRDTATFLALKNDSIQDTWRWLIQDTKPSGGAWTESAVNGLEVGVEHNQAQVRVLYLDTVFVNVLISTTATPLGGKSGRMTLLGVQ